MGCLQSKKVMISHDIKPRCGDIYREGNLQQNNMNLSDSISNEWNRKQIQEFASEKEKELIDKNTIQVIKELGI